MATYFEGLLLGLAFIAPLGIANLFIINTALNQPRHTAYLTATVVAVFDVFLSIVCFYGVGQLLMQYQLLKVGILLVGGILVALIGINIMRTEAQPPSATEQNFSWVKVFSMALMVTWLNPQALIDGSVMLAAFRVSLSPEAALLFITGIVTAAFVWYLGLTGALSRFKHKLTQKRMTWFNRICGAVVVLYGVKLLWNFIKTISA